ncbi:MAG: flagellar basal body rod protein FlgB [Rhodospirillaceae bacterium]|nr:flagellar basal body rod protein FlgB [Rhodospirillaceae bacterium]
MELGKLSLFKIIGARMSYLSERQKVLSENIANADTPHYRPSDLKPMDFQAVLRGDQRIKMAVTNKIHLAGTNQAPMFGTEKAAFGKSYETSPNGNAVVLEEQMLKLSQGQSSYQLAANIYQKNMSMLRTAIGRAQ